MGADGADDLLNLKLELLRVLLLLFGFGLDNLQKGMQKQQSKSIISNIAVEPITTEAINQVSAVSDSSAKLSLLRLHTKIKENNIVGVVL